MSDTAHMNTHRDGTFSFVDTNGQTRGTITMTDPPAGVPLGHCTWYAFTAHDAAGNLIAIGRVSGFVTTARLVRTASDTTPPIPGR